MKIAVYREEHFNAAHRLNNPDWPEDKNRKTFGKCNLPSYHGHNYRLIVKVTGQPDPETGFVVDMKWLSALIKDEIIERFDHRNLNVDCEEFQNLNPTAENISLVIWNILRPKINSELDLKIILYETERNFVECPAD